MYLIPAAAVSAGLPVNVRDEALAVLEVLEVLEVDELDSDPEQPPRSDAKTTRVDQMYAVAGCFT